MTAQTLQRIQQTIQKLNYRPSSVARSLVTNQTATIGVIVAEINTPLFLQALNYIEPMAREAGHNILLCTARTIADEKEAVNLLLEKQVDGIVFLSTSVYQEDDYLTNLPASTPPIVLINHTTTHSRFNHINLDNQGGMLAAMDYAVELGHRHIAHLTGPISRRSRDERIKGYQQGLEKHGLPWNADYLQPGDYDQGQASWAESTRKLLSLSPRPTAIIAANDTVASVVIRTVQRDGFRIPEDISIIGIDGQPFCTYLNPALTTVRLPIIEAGRMAIDLLLPQIFGAEIEPQQLLLPCSLIIRESTGPAPVEVQQI